MRGGGSDASGVANTAKIASWNGVNWESLPSTYGGLGSAVKDMVVYNDTLIIGTNFPSSSTRICAYDVDISDYIDIGSVPFASTLALAVFNGELYAGGVWNVLKKYIGGTGLAAWEDVGGHMNDYILDMTVDTFNNFLYMGGGFTIVDDSIFTDNVAIWNGFYWEKVGYGNSYQSSCLSIAVYNGDLYSGLSYDTIGGVYTSRLARWDGTNWHNVGGSVKWGINAMEVFQNRLYIGGEIDTIGGIHQKGIACWQDTTPNCRHLKPRVFSDTTTYYLVNDTAQVQFYNNNAYVDTWAWDFGDTGASTIKDPSHIYTDTGTYTAEVIVTHGTCVDTATKTIVVDYPVNVGKVNKKEIGFKLYPNPTSNTLFVEMTPKSSREIGTGSKGDLKNKNLQIIDINGKVVLSTSLKYNVIASNEVVKQSVDISALSDGIYFVRIGKQTERFVKE